MKMSKTLSARETDKLHLTLLFKGKDFPMAWQGICQQVAW
jgi:hypothetical protein